MPLYHVDIATPHIPSLHPDFLVIGAGVAGLRAAIELAQAGQVLVLAKSDWKESSSEYAQGGIASAVGPGDTPGQHAADTMAAGDGLCDAEAVRVLVEDGVRSIPVVLQGFDTPADNTNGQKTQAKILDPAFDNNQMGRLADRALHRLPIQLSVGLSAGALHGRAL